MLHTELRQAMKEHPCSMIKEQKRRMVVFTKQLKLVQGQPKHNSRECGQKICTKCPSDDRSTSYPHAYFHHITIWTEMIIFSVKYFHHLAIVCLKGPSIFTQGFVHFLLKGNGAYKGFTMHNRKSTEVTHSCLQHVQQGTVVWFAISYLHSPHFSLCNTKMQSEPTRTTFVLEVSSLGSLSPLCCTQHLALLAYSGFTLGPNGLSVCLSTFLSKFRNNDGLDLLYFVLIQCPCCVACHDGFSKKKNVRQAELPFFQRPFHSCIVKLWIQQNVVEG